MGLNFYYYDGLQPKLSAGIINEHECIENFSYQEILRKKSQLESYGIFLTVEQDKSKQSYLMDQIGFLICW